MYTSPIEFVARMLGRTSSVWQDRLVFATASLAGRIERAEARLAADFGVLARQWRAARVEIAGNVRRAGFELLYTRAIRPPRD